MVGALRDPPPIDDVVQEPLFDDPLSIVARRGHPLTLRRTVTPADLIAYPWVAPAEETPARAVFDRLFPPEDVARMPGGLIVLNNEERWEEFRELDLDDQNLVRGWLIGEPETDDEDEDESGNGQPRRFDALQLVDSELVGSFIDRTFLDPDDDRVLDEILTKEIAPGITVGSMIDRETLRMQMKQQLAARAEQPAEIPVSPQRRRQTMRKRLDERTKAVAARVLQDLDLSRNGREVARALGKGPDANVKVLIRVLGAEVNEYLGIPRGTRKEMSREQAEDAYGELDNMGDAARDRIRKAIGR